MKTIKPYRPNKTLAKLNEALARKKLSLTSRSLVEPVAWGGKSRAKRIAIQCFSEEFSEENRAQEYL